MSGSSRRRYSSVLAILGILVLAVILAIVVSSLSWPFGSGVLGSNGNNSTVTVQRQFGLLNFSAILSENYSVIPRCSQCNATSIETVSNFSINIKSIESIALNSSISGMQVNVITANTGTILYSGVTLNGTYKQLVPPGFYTLRTSDSNTQYDISKSIQIIGGYTTDVVMVVLKTSYGTSFYDIYNQDSAGTIGNWQDVFVSVPTSHPIVNVGQSVSIEGTLSSPVNPQYSQPATVLSQSVNNSTGVLSMDLRPQASLNVNGISSMSITKYSTQITENIVNGTS